MTKSLTLAEKYPDIYYSRDLFIEKYNIDKDVDINYLKKDIFRILSDNKIIKYKDYMTLEDIRYKVTVEQFEKALAIYLLRK